MINGIAGIVERRVKALTQVMGEAVTWVKAVTQ
jgi:hypothetical protein